MLETPEMPCVSTTPSWRVTTGVMDETGARSALNAKP